MRSAAWAAITVALAKRGLQVILLEPFDERAQMARHNLNANGVGELVEVVRDRRNPFATIAERIPPRWFIDRSSVGREGLPI